MRYFEGQTAQRPIPCIEYKRMGKNNKFSLLPLQEITNANGGSEWAVLRSENELVFKNSTLRQYDCFKVVFHKKDLMNLCVGQRKTSSYMVWHGVVFALDLVRKRCVNRSAESDETTESDSVGVFLYCQGLECCDHIWIKYALKTVNHEHALQCSDYKMMQLNFQKGNGSRDFFGCSWNTFLNTYFDTNDLLRFQLQFIDAK